MYMLLYVFLSHLTSSSQVPIKLNLHLRKYSGSQIQLAINLCRPLRKGKRSKLLYKLTKYYNKSSLTRGKFIEEIRILFGYLALYL